MSQVGDNIISQNANWEFDENVVPGFDNHVSRSVHFWIWGNT